MEKILFSSLEKIFIEKRIYRDIEEAESWEEVIATIDKGLKPHKKKFYREITRDDIVKTYGDQDQTYFQVRFVQGR